MIAAEEYWHLHRAGYRNTLIYAHTTSRTLPPCGISLGSLQQSAPESGGFVELILLHQTDLSISTHIAVQPLPFHMLHLSTYEITTRKIPTWENVRA
jgi:hypothetical protein